MTEHSYYRTSSTHGVFTVHLVGEIDPVAMPELQHVLRAYHESLPGDVVVDLGEVTFMSSTGLAFIVALERASGAHGHTVVLCNIPPATIRLLQITGLTRFLPREGRALRTEPEARDGVTRPVRDEAEPPLPPCRDSLEPDGNRCVGGEHETVPRTSAWLASPLVP